MEGPSTALTRARTVLAGVLVHSSNEWTQLESAILSENVMTRLRVLQSIAVAANNSRSPLNGYPASAAYLSQQLAEFVSCTPAVTTFPSIQSRQVAPPRLFVDSVELQFGVDFVGLRDGGNGDYDLTREVFSVASLGCAAADYVGLKAGQLALVLVVTGPQDCSLYQKGLLAQQAGAGGVLLRNDFALTALPIARMRSPDYKPGDPLMQVPVLALSYSVGQRLLSASKTAVRVVVSTRIDFFTSFNTCCETTVGDPANVLVVGAHLDSGQSRARECFFFFFCEAAQRIRTFAVSAGPGINDDGSGSMALLEIAVQWNAIGMQPVSRVRFCWWGSEEEGLVGSRAYVAQLNAAERARIAGYINMDMLGSPNFVRFVYNGTDALPAARSGSTRIQSAITDYFRTASLAHDLTPMVAGSDFVPFMQIGIPTSGVLTGAGAIKTDAQRSKYGGVANAPLDPCYHQACDTTDNIDHHVLQDMARAAAHALYRLSSYPNLRTWLNGP